MQKRLLLLAAMVGAFAGSSAQAQPARDFSTVRYRPAIGPNNYLGLEGTDAKGHLRLSYGVAFDFSKDTLDVEHPGRRLRNTRDFDDHEINFVQRTSLVHLLFGMSISARTQLSLDLPFGGTDSNLLSYSLIDGGGMSPFRAWRPREGFAFADARLLGKTRFYESADHHLRLAAAAHTTLPTAMLTSHGSCRQTEQCTFLGERGVQVGAFGIAEYVASDKLRVAVNAGAQYRPKRELLGAGVSSEVTFGGGVAYTPVRYLDLKAELVGAVALVGDGHDVPLEARGGVSYGRDLIFTLGGGGGIVGDVGSPTFRVLAGAQWTPVRRDADRDGFEDERDPCPTKAEDFDGFEDGDGCPELDNDKDGVPDSQDACRDLPEDRDDFQDEDGCPDPDNDGDGVPDGYDSCEGLKEDIDGDHDDDGCPDLDTDRDGVPDGADNCPAEMEDTDGIGDDDGCPETDFDQDGIDDTVDQCPEEAESKNGIKDDDGCPEG